MKALAKLAVLAVVVAVAVEGMHWLREALPTQGPADAPGAAFASYGGVFRYDALSTDVDIRVIGDRPGAYFLPLQIEPFDVRLSDDGEQLLTLQHNSDVAVLTVFEVGKSQPVRTYTFLAPEFAQHIDSNGLWTDILGSGEEPYFYSKD